MLTDEMIEAARAQGAKIGRSVLEGLVKKPKIARTVDRLFRSIVREFAIIMKNNGLADPDIEVLCQTLVRAYRAELAVGNSTKH